jgi:hypothetical protein
VEATESEPERPFALWRWLRWYPLVLVALAGTLWWLVPRGEGPLAPPGPAAALPSAGAPTSTDGVFGLAPIPAEGPSLAERGWDRAVALEGAAERVAGAFGLRMAEGVRGLRERVGREELEAGGLKAARLTPFVGPYLRYQHARDLHATGEPDLQARARRQTVIALAELSLDVGATGLGHAASGSEGLLHAMEGVVEAADFADFALSLHAELGAPLGFAGLDRLDGEVDELAALALREVVGLEAFVDRLLTVERPDWLEDVPPGLADEARELLAELLQAARAVR